MTDDSTTDLLTATNISSYPDKCECCGTPVRVVGGTTKSYESAYFALPHTGDKTELPRLQGKPREWWAYFTDYNDLSFGFIQSKMRDGMSNKGSEIRVVEALAYEALQAELEYTKRTYADERSGDCDLPVVKSLRWELNKTVAEVARLRSALDIITTKLSGVVPEPDSGPGPGPGFFDDSGRIK